MSAVGTIPALHIAVGIIQDERGRVLISQRRAGTDGEGQWEFPGGKREAQESVPDALRRELAEELGITVVSARPFITVHHDYPNRRVFLDTWLITEWSGEAVSLEGQALAWVAPEGLQSWQLLEADVPIVNALRLPESYLFTGDDPAQPGHFLRRLEGSLSAGLRLVRLRAPSLEPRAYESLAADCLRLCEVFRAQLILDRDAEMIGRIGAHGLHVDSRTLRQLEERPVGADRWFAASCHDGAELAQAERLRADFAVLGPVLATPSHHAAQPLGWDRFTELTAGVSIPVYALGGVAPRDLPVAWQCGARGIAAIRSLWRAS